MIVGRISNVLAVFNVLLTGPHFCAFISLHERKIAEDIIKKSIPAELRHLAVATYAATTSPWNIHHGHHDLYFNQTLSDSYVNSVVRFVERYRRPDGFTLQSHHAKGLTLWDASVYLPMNNAICIYSRRLVALAMSATPKVLGFVPEISHSVLLRYAKALYITQIVAEIFAWRGGGQTTQMHMAWGMFWYALTPWEVEQVFGVQTLLAWYVYNDIIRVFPEHYVNHDNGTTALGRFVNFLGPTRLRTMEQKGGHKNIATAFDFFRLWNPVGFIYSAHCAPGFGMRLVLDRIGHRLSQGKENGSPAYGDIDIGPMKNWYYIFLFGGLEDRRGGQPCSFFSCMRCLTLSGYAFWDEIKPSCLPTYPIEEMHRMAVDMHERAFQALNGAPGKIFTPLWFRKWQNHTCQNAIPVPATGQLLPPPYHTHEYSFRPIGQLLAEEKERTR
ncbi:hypothetical protein CHU98_g5318 [Xylaria longipes]|nr:hypothetical protein CHU98_g5318 [Xylaria longipes]